jgi:RecB family endonuclease NucS
MNPPEGKGKKQYLINPAQSTAARFIRENHIETPTKTTLIMVGRCKIEYRGRAKSYLDWGERIIIIKSDGTVLVHKDIQRNPINWQPEGTTLMVQCEKKFVVLKTINHKKRERMNATFDKIDIIYTTSLRDHAQLEIVGMEYDLTKKIEKNPELIEPGFRVIRREKHTKSGLIDLRGCDKDNTPVIIEVKRGKATISAAHQLRMYINDIKKLNPSAPVRGILVAPYIPALVKNLLDDYELEYKEIRIKHELARKQQQKLEGFFQPKHDTKK